MTELHIVTACTNRKRGVVGARRVGDLLPLPIEQRADAWWERLTAMPASDAAPAKDLYIGSHWQRSRLAVDEVTASQVFDAVHLHVMSAGYGLIPASETISPYAATFASTSPDCVLREDDRPTAWWELLSQHRLPGASARSLHELACRSPRAKMVIVGSTQYLGAVARDLHQAAGELPPENVSVICGGTVPRPVRRFALDLDGSKAVGLDARMIDLAASALLHLAKTVNTHAFRHTTANEVLSEIPSVQAPSAVRRARAASDDELRTFIADVLSASDAGSKATKTAALRRLRSESDLACEYSRFGRLYDEVAASID